MLTLPFEFTSTPPSTTSPTAITSSIAVVGVLLEAGADLKILVRCCRAVCGSCRLEYYMQVIQMITLSFEFTSTPPSSSTSSIAVVRLLVEAGADINAKDSNMTTANSFAVVWLLVEADVSIIICLFI